MPKLKILHVEDDLDIQEITKISLEVIGGFEILQCASGKQAIAEAIGFMPDVFLLDVMMPEMSGDIVFKHLQELPGLGKTPAIFMTARAQKDEVMALREIGAIEVILKPFDPMTLPDQIKSAILASKKYRP